MSFYAVFVFATVAGAVLDLLDVDPIRALYWSALVNGLLAPFLLLALLAICGDRVLMRGQPSSRLTRGVVALTTLLMFAAAVGMFLF